MPRQRQTATTLDSMLNAVRREAAHATRLPRAALEAAVGQLLRAAAPHPPTDVTRPTKQYRVDDLARAAGTTVRNVRAYQERGLLHPPQRVGRIAVFDESHLARLKLVTSMLDRGYTSANIAEMLTAWEKGDDLADVLGLERLVRPWAADEPTTMPLREVRELAGDEADLERLVADKLVDIRGNHAVVQRPRLLRAFAEARGYGVPMDRMLSVHEQIAPMLEDIGRILVVAGAREAAAPLPAADEVSERSVNDMVTMLLRFRALAMESVMATLEHAIDRRIETLLADYVAQLAGATTEANADAG
jgi:DNA-binding transcriptional MerR regulator